MQEDWNGNGAKPISPTLIQKVKDIISNLDIQLEIFPTANGTIQLEYEEDLGFYVEFEISDNDKMKLFVISPESKEGLATFPCTPEIINRAIHKYYLD